MAVTSSPSAASPALRASDADRERVAAALRRHHLDGRLDTDELQERLGACYAAKTEAELAALVADLPGAAPPRTARAAGPPGGGRAAPARGGRAGARPVCAVGGRAARRARIRHGGRDRPRPSGSA